ncbi:RNA polymerase sigma70 factor [Gordoniibacillus kamchatkensis]|uniref:RNA polymerase sigma70 factor n=2 Tax=Gordoniibacillus kamchatkensis TaxID=1590651 RepID=A0ABR5AG27_9BACL|nr:RNA polymerase sigma70 factor [Paenibacillus sp. VKM B-2647]
MCAVEQAVRDSYGKLMAYITARWRDIAMAEDALADAVVAALQTWPRVGVPDKPEAWLLAVARRRLVDAVRKQKVLSNSLPQLISRIRSVQDEISRVNADSETVIPDERLEMMFLCAHPAIDRSIRSPLMLQTVLGLDAARIASAFLVKPSTMGQRLSRAKAKIRTARIRFERPEPTELPQRLDAVLEAVYAAYGSGWEEVHGGDSRLKGLTGEAIYLGRLLVRLLPDEPEAKGLLALMLHCEARRDARRNQAGEYVPLTEQVTALWSDSMIREAERLLTEAAQARRPGRYQLEAAIQSVHAHRAITGRTDWEAVAALYEGLVYIAPTVGAKVGQAAAAAEAYGPAKGLALLELMPPELVHAYQPYWAVAARLYKKLGQFEKADAAYSRAVGLCTDAAMREFLIRKSYER